MSGNETKTASQQLYDRAYGPLAGALSNTRSRNFEGIDLSNIYQQCDDFFDNTPEKSDVETLEDLVNHLRKTLQATFFALVLAQKLPTQTGQISHRFATRPELIDGLFASLAQIDAAMIKMRIQSDPLRHIIDSLEKFNQPPSLTLTLELVERPKEKSEAEYRRCIDSNFLATHEEYRILLAKNKNGLHPPSIATPFKPKLPRADSQISLHSPRPTRTPMIERLGKCYSKNLDGLKNNITIFVKNIKSHFKAPLLTRQSTHEKEMPKHLKTFYNKLKNIDLSNIQNWSETTIKVLLTSILDDIEIILFTTMRERVVDHTIKYETYYDTSNMDAYFHKTRRTGKIFLIPKEQSPYETQLRNFALSICHLLDNDQFNLEKLIVNNLRNILYHCLPDRIEVLPSIAKNRTVKNTTVFKTISDKYQYLTMDLPPVTESYSLTTSTSTTVILRNMPPPSPLQTQITRVLHQHQDLIPRTHLLRNYWGMFRALQKPQPDEQLRTSSSEFSDILSRMDDDGPFSEFSDSLRKTLN